MEPIASTLTVAPTDLSGTSDRKFWSAAATISTVSRIRVPLGEETVDEVRAYDGNGTLLGTTRRPWVPLVWIAFDGEPLPAEATLDTLLQHIPELVADPTVWSPTGPTGR